MRLPGNGVVLGRTRAGGELRPAPPASYVLLNNQGFS